MVHANLVEEVFLENGLGRVVHIRNVSGGCINQCYSVKTDSGRFFLKCNGNDAADLFECEARGLNILRQEFGGVVPAVHALTTCGGYQWLVLQWIESAPSHADFWWQFGTMVADLHRCTSAVYGLDHQNYIGSLRQVNNHESSWVDFFWNHRIEPQVRLAVDAGKMASAAAEKIESLCHRADRFFPNEPPALLHGDLWSGNYMCTGQGQPALFDPAVYYGHRYMDLGMTRLFGGFHPHFYEAYHRAYPLVKDWEHGADLANLYPLLVHVNLFGRSYLSQIDQILTAYG
ncbi:MAG: fructosamine kinase family protein [Salibacteraceae bacterium]